MGSDFKYIYKALIVLLCLTYFGECTRCFECRYASTPQGCGHIKICNSSESCFLEQFVTSTGNIVFNSGCASQLECLGSRRMVHSFQIPLVHKTDNRKRDISICKDCCTSDYCNMRGCGVPETPREQRGPYCYYCDGLQDPSSCRNVILCSKDEVCGLYKNTNKETFRSTCLKKSTSDAFMQLNNDPNCTTNCCGKDFCNGHCGEKANITTETLSPSFNAQSTPSENLMTDVHSSTTNIPTPTITTASQHSYPTDQYPSTRKYTSQPTTIIEENSLSTNDLYSTSMSKPVYHCDTSDGYIDLTNVSSQTNLCIHVVHIHANWDEAERGCAMEGGHLAILDTLGKSQLLRHHLIENGQHNQYWIGGRDHFGNQTFEWVNGVRVEGPQTDWYQEQPDDTHEHCLVMVKMDQSEVSYQWRDRHCHNEVNYICERDSSFEGSVTLKSTVSVRQTLHTHDYHTLSSTTSSRPTPSTTTHKREPEYRCDTTDNYIDLKSTDSHIRLCVHIVNERKYNQAGKEQHAEGNATTTTRAICLYDRQ